MTNTAAHDEALAQLRWLAERGAKFCLPAGRTKKQFSTGWQNNPQDLAAAEQHALHGGNVGLLCGLHSDGIVVFDVDVNWTDQVARLGDFAHTPTVDRDNAPDRGKLLYQVDGDLPKSASWSADPTQKKPDVELISTGRHALIPPSQFEGGRYLLHGAEYGIRKVTPAELAAVWFLLTGTLLGERHAPRESAPAGAGLTRNPFVAAVKARWDCLGVFQHFGRVTADQVQRRSNGELHVRGNAGLLVRSDRWFCHGDSAGGDNLDAWHWCETGRVLDRGDQAAFWRTVEAMAAAAGIEKPRQQPPAVEQDAGDGDDYLLREDRGDLGNAVCTARRHAGRFLYTDAFGWLAFTGTHWNTETAEAQVHAAIVDTLKARSIAAIRAENDKLLQASTPSAKHTRDTLYHFRHMQTVSSGEFDQEPHLLNCQNGVIDLRTGDLAAHERSNRFTYCLPVGYEPGAQSDLWQNLLLDWFQQNHELALYVQRAMGYTVTGATKEECLFYAYGPGRAGKGTFVNTVAELLGSQLARGLKFDALTDGARDPQNFRLAPLRTVRMVAASESKKAERLDEGLVKQITGRDQVDAALKHRDSFSFIPQFKLWIMSNHPPRGDVEDASFWGRIRLISFVKSYQGTEDTAIKDALRAPDNRRGLLTWLVIGAQKWYATGLQTPPQVFQSVQKVRDEQDTVGMWLLESTEDNPAIDTLLDDVYRSYTEWCSDNGTRHPYTKHVLAQRLAARGYVTERRRLGSERARIVNGLQIS